MRLLGAMSRAVPRHIERKKIKVIDGDTFLRLLGINEELIKVCRSLNEERDFDTASRLQLIADDLTHVVGEIIMQK